MKLNPVKSVDSENSHIQIAGWSIKSEISPLGEIIMNKARKYWVIVTVKKIDWSIR